MCVDNFTKQQRKQTIIRNGYSYVVNFLVAIFNGTMECAEKFKYVYFDGGWELFFVRRRRGGGRDNGVINRGLEMKFALGVRIVRK